MQNVTKKAVLVVKKKQRLRNFYLVTTGIFLCILADQIRILLRGRNFEALHLYILSISLISCLVFFILKRLALSKTESHFISSYIGYGAAIGNYKWGNKREVDILIISDGLDCKTDKINPFELIGLDCKINYNKCLPERSFFGIKPLRKYCEKKTGFNQVSLYEVYFVKQNKYLTFFAPVDIV